jgi:hypothetical protein
MKNKILVPHIESPSLVEIWKWKEESSEELNGMSAEERIKYLNDKAKDYSKKFNLKILESNTVENLKYASKK